VCETEDDRREGREKAMSQGSGLNPSLSDRVKKTMKSTITPKKPKR
jgi:hypothetical protein